MITSLPEHHVFVFDSNLKGIHGAGAARTAADKFGARWGHGVGPCGQSYAIPTKATPWAGLHLHEIHEHVDRFLDYARNHPHLTFHVTAIGCGLAGRVPGEIAPMFREAPGNVILPEAFVTELTTNH